MNDGRPGGLIRLAAVSGAYDLLLAAAMLGAPVAVAGLFGAPPPVPVVNAQLNGLFALAVGVGYFWALRERARLRGYLWIFNVLAKGLGALLFVFDHFARGSPVSFLAFAVCDGVLALVTLRMLSAGRRGMGAVTEA